MALIVGLHFSSKKDKTPSLKVKNFPSIFNRRGFTKVVTLPRGFPFFFFFQNVREDKRAS